MKGRPLGSRVVVRVDVAGDMTATGRLFVPEQGKEALKTGTAIAVGLGDKTKSGARVPMDVVVGDRVLFGAFSGTKTEIDAQPVLILREAEILYVWGAEDGS